MEKNRVLNHSITHSIKHPSSLFDAPETEAPAQEQNKQEKNEKLCYSVQTDFNKASMILKSKLKSLTCKTPRLNIVNCRAQSCQCTIMIGTGEMRLLTVFNPFTTDPVKTLHFAILV